MSIIRNKENVYTGDYVKLNLCEGWYKVVFVSDDYIDLVDDFGMNTDARYEDITDLKLESEMDYNF